MTDTLAASVSTANAADGTFVVMALIIVWAFSVKGKGPVRAISAVALLIVAWLLLGMHDGPGAIAVASGTIRGLAAALSAIGVLVSGH